LHRANGGYLVLEARKVLAEPFAWEALKRALKAGNIAIESPGQSLSLVATVSLEPEPIPLDLKVVLIGERLIYYLLSELDPEFPELFKIEADFDETMDRSSESEERFLGGLAERIQSAGLRPFAVGAIAEVLRRAVRLAGDREKLSIEWRSVTDLLQEANHLAGRGTRELVSAEDVRKAVDQQIRRADRMREKSLEAIRRNHVLIDCSGTRIGQINGLSVLQLGGFAFGRPNRITARVRLGAGKVIDIEREVELGGPLHSKGILILSGFLSARYAPKEPFSLSATLVFEQSYGGIDGDSASAAELCSLLSALAELPLRQDLAVTGSVNQLGDIQAIGGVNEKIEGFFDLCKARGLTGNQGVLIPEVNRDHLVLRDDVVAAVTEGQFHIYPICSIDQGIALLTGVEAGERDGEGLFPEKSVNGLVEQRLRSFAQARRDFGRIGQGDAAEAGAGGDGASVKS
jgi:lon-related putative ATP-dependent protease